MESICVRRGTATHRTSYQARQFQYLLRAELWIRPSAPSPPIPRQCDSGYGLVAAWTTRPRFAWVQCARIRTAIVILFSDVGRAAASQQRRRGFFGKKSALIITISVGRVSLHVRVIVVVDIISPGLGEFFWTNRMPSGGGDSNYWGRAAVGFRIKVKYSSPAASSLRVPTLILVSLLDTPVQSRRHQHQFYIPPSRPHNRPNVFRHMRSDSRTLAHHRSGLTLIPITWLFGNPPEPYNNNKNMWSPRQPIQNYMSIFDDQPTQAEGTREAEGYTRPFPAPK